MTDLYNAELFIRFQIDGDDVEEQLEAIADRIGQIAIFVNADITSIDMGWTLP